MSLSVFSTALFVPTIGFYIIKRGYLKFKQWDSFVLDIKRKEKEINNKYYYLKKDEAASIEILAQTIEAKDPYTRGHCLRVKEFSRAIGRELNFDGDRILFLEFSALLHDIGKIGIPGAILNKNSSLTEEEYAIIKKHPEIGTNIIKNINFLKPILPMIKYHHEHFDGRGYPEGLKGDDIPLEARILAISDVFDALSSDRPYRRAIKTKEALKILMEKSGTQLDPLIVEIFISSNIYKLKLDSVKKLKFDF